MTTSRIITGFLIAIVLAPVACALPDGAVVQWELEKAWRKTSSHRESICLNGVWEWRSEKLPEAPAQPARIVWNDEDDEDAGFAAWKVNHPGGGAKLKATFDRERKTTGKGSLRVDASFPNRMNAYHVQRTFSNLPVGKRLVLKMDILSQVNGDSFIVEIVDNRGFIFYCVVGPRVAKSDSWQSYSMPFSIPSGSPGITIRIMRNLNVRHEMSGTSWFDNIRIEEQHTPEAGVTVPMPEDGNWGHAVIPQHFRYELVWPHPKDPQFKHPRSGAACWSRRRMRIPSSWSGRRVALRFEALSTEGVVFCNGKEVGKLGFEGGSLDITQHSSPGSELEIAVLTQVRPVWHFLPMTKDGIYYQSKGICGDVFLDACPNQERIGDMTVNTFVTPTKRIRVTAPLERGQLAGRALECRCDILDGSRNVLSFTGKVDADAKSIALESPWGDAVCWDYENPKLYQLTLTLLADGQAIDQTLPQRIGFREFKIEGKYFYLNGIKTNLVPCAYWANKGNWHTGKAIRHWVRKAIKGGFNYVYTDQLSSPGQAHVLKHFLEICDEEGIMVGADTIRIKAVSDDQDPRWERILKYIERAGRNHPSLVMWRMNMNACGYSQDQNPHCLDGKQQFAPGSAEAAMEKRLLFSNERMSALDPTRPNYNHACGKIGSIYTLNNYLGWPELQDLREWLRNWAEHGDKPLFMVEQATPYPGDFQMRDPSNWWRNEPVMTEYGAILLGDLAYELEEDEFVDFPAREWNAKEQRWGWLYNYYTYHFPPIIDICSTKYYQVMLPAWRTWGLPGGCNAWENAWRRTRKEGKQPIGIPLDWDNLQQPGFVSSRWVFDDGAGGELRMFFDLDTPDEKSIFEPTLRGREMPKLTAPLFAYIGGPVKQWYTVEHAFYEGETIEKSLVLLNDLRKTATFEYSWQCVADGKELASGKGSIAVTPGNNAKVRLEAVAPSTSKKLRARWLANVTVDGKPVEVAPFEMEIHPRKQSTLLPKGEWRLFDPLGMTRSALERRGLSIPELTSLEGIGVLVLGRQALAEGRRIPNLDKHVRNGLKVIVLEQDAKTLKEVFAFRTLPAGIRHLNIRQAKHPVLAGIDHVDLKDWRGKATLEPLEGPPTSLSESQREKRVWRCSQEGIVASTVVEKPHLSTFSPILDGGFDLRYMALWETSIGQGRIVFSQLDLTERLGIDPVADSILDNVIGYLNEVPKPEAREKGRHVRILHRGDTPDWAELKTFLESGGTLVACGLKGDTVKNLAELGGFSVAESLLWKNGLDSSALPHELRGISPAEIHWRCKRAVPVVKSANGWISPTGVLASIPIGKGRLLWSSGCVDDFTQEERPDLIFTRMNVIRLETLLLGNAGLQVGLDWAGCLSGGESPAESKLYADKRTVRDDPYAYMRW